MMKKFCDRCGHEIPQKGDMGWDNGANLGLPDVVRADLCTQCRQTLRDFMEMRPISGKEDIDRYD